MGYIWELISAAILGIIQGLTEFLPISSSAHLIIIPWLTGWEQKGIAFDVFVHVGTAISVLVFFRNEWIQLAKETIAGLREGRTLGNPQRKLAWLLGVGTIPAVIAGLVFEDQVENIRAAPMITVFTLTAFGLLLYAAEKLSKQNRTIHKLSWTDSILIGISQAIALIPGVSRSGITMTTALMRNCDRSSAARFSFLLSTPIIVGAGVLKSWQLVRTLSSSSGGMTGDQWPVLLLGILFSSVTGFLCIRYFLRYIQTKSFTPFVIYRFVLAGIVLLYYLRS